MEASIQGRAGLLSNLWHRRSLVIAIVTVTAIAMHLLLRFVFQAPAETYQMPLLAAIVLGGIPLLAELLGKVLARDFGSDLLGGIAIVTSFILDEYLAGSIIVLMLSGGAVLESYALASASSVLAALAKRMPSIAHRMDGSDIVDIGLAEVAVDDLLVIYPHETCPVDGVVAEGSSVMDESYLTGEPFKMTKTVGSNVISGAINGDSVLKVRTTTLPADSRYAKIMQVMQESESTRPKMRRLGDQLGAFYTPFVLAIACCAWMVSGESVRFLAVLVIATPCPLLIGIPVAVIGSISLCARRGIIVKSPIALEQISECRTAIFDKTGTLTYGEPTLTEQRVHPNFEASDVLMYAAGLERYSRHPLAGAIIDAAKSANMRLIEASNVGEAAGRGLQGKIAGRLIEITSRNNLQGREVPGLEHLPERRGGLECIVLVDQQYAATYSFRDAPRADSQPFVSHLPSKHRFARTMIISGDRESEVRYLAQEVGITDVHAQKSPEEKLAIVRAETATAKTLYVGDGINDAPAMMAATVGVSVGQNSDVTAEAADVVILDNSLLKVDEFMHISRRMRTIALQSAIGGMALSLIGIAFAAAGYLSPVNGAIAQEIIDVLAVLNALRVALPPKRFSDC